MTAQGLVGGWVGDGGVEVKSDTGGRGQCWRKLGLFFVSFPVSFLRIYV